MAEESRKRLSGTTWNVYLHILTSERPQGVREVWRALNLSTPSLAQYHINKLLEMRLIEPTQDGKYQINGTTQMDTLRGFVLLRGHLIPRLVFYSALMLGILSAYLFFWPFRWDFRDLVVLTVSVFSILAFSFEAYNQYRGLRSSQD